MKTTFVIAVCSAAVLVACGTAEETHRLADKRYAPQPDYVTANEPNGIGYMQENQQQLNTGDESYKQKEENRFAAVATAPLSTFSIDVDKASYSNVRRFLNENQLPPPEAVRVEEMINYFTYNYPQPEAKSKHPFTVSSEVAVCPWNPKHKLVHIGLKGKEISMKELPANNLVFLVDVSGSMRDVNKLPLVKEGLKMLVENMRPKDRVAIVTYAGDAGLKLRPTSGDDKEKINEAIDNLVAGGSTAGAAGLQVAYEVANRFFDKKANNRVILCSDGDFNVGMSSDAEMETLIESKRDEGISLTVLGFGMGNLKDSKMEILADKGNGNYAYIDDLLEAKKVLVNEMTGTLFTIAKDVKLQVEFNPAKVKGYRLVGYENRLLNAEDFNDDHKDAGDMGAGHTVTALYEIIPAGSDEKVATVDALKYQKANGDVSPELLTIKCRYKQPNDTSSVKFDQPLADANTNWTESSENFRFAIAVAQFGMLLRHSEHSGVASYENTILLAKNARGKDEEGYRAEFIRLAEKAQLLAKAEPASGTEERLK